MSCLRGYCATVESYRFILTTRTSFCVNIFWLVYGLALVIQTLVKLALNLGGEEITLNLEICGSSKLTHFVIVPAIP